MKALIAVGLILNAALLFTCGLYLKQLSASVPEGEAAGVIPVVNGDVNGSGVIDISDATYLLNWLFLGGPAPVACAGESDPALEERVAFLESVVASCLPDADEDGVPDCADEDFTRDSDRDGVVDAKDCAPLDPLIHPGRVETCFDGIDNDCSGEADESCDLDGDGFCAEIGCGTPPDCNDGNPAIHPAAEDVCDGVDNDCDGRVDNGVDADTNPPCGGAVMLGSVSGDTSGPTLPASGRGEAWFRLEIREDDNNVFSPEDLAARIALSSPPGADYDLFVYCGGCGGNRAGFSAIASQSSHTDIAFVSREDGIGSDQTFAVFIEIRYSGGGNGCANWSLAVTGDVAGPSATCP